VVMTSADIQSWQWHGKTYARRCTRSCRCFSAALFKSLPLTSLLPSRPLPIVVLFLSPPRIPRPSQNPPRLTALPPAWCGVRPCRPLGHSRRRRRSLPRRRPPRPPPPLPQRSPRPPSRCSCLLSSRNRRRSRVPLPARNRRRRRSS
jgi:hypothetical protein